MGNEDSMTCRGRVSVLAFQISCCLEAGAITGQENGGTLTVAWRSKTEGDVDFKVKADS